MKDVKSAIEREGGEKERDTNRSSERNENLPGRQNISSGDLDGRSSESFLRLSMTDDLRRDEDRSI